MQQRWDAWGARTVADKNYIGDRTIDGVIVTVDDAPLLERIELKAYTDRGFEWSYEGDGPRQLALALLCDHFGDDGVALKEADRFMRRVVANFGNTWQMSSTDIATALDNIRASA